LAIEVKRSATLHSTDLRALHEFRKDYPTAVCYVLHGGTTTQYLGDITAIPVQQALPDLENLLANVQRSKR
jgi:hypothetical protein